MSNGGDGVQPADLLDRHGVWGEGGVVVVVVVAVVLFSRDRWRRCALNDAPPTLLDHDVSSDVSSDACRARELLPWPTLS